MYFRDEHEIVVHSDDGFAPVLYLRLKSFHLEGKEQAQCNLSFLRPTILLNSLTKETTDGQPCVIKADLPFANDYLIKNLNKDQTDFSSVSISGPCCYINGIVGLVKTPNPTEGDIKICAKDAFSQMIGQWHVHLKFLF